MLSKSGIDTFVKSPLTRTNPSIVSSAGKDRFVSFAFPESCSPPGILVTAPKSSVFSRWLSEKMIWLPELIAWYGIVKLSKCVLLLIFTAVPTGHTTHATLLNAVFAIVISWISPSTAPDTATTDFSSAGSPMNWSTVKFRNAGNSRSSSFSRFCNLSVETVFREPEVRDRSLETCWMSMFPVTVFIPSREMSSGPSTATLRSPVKVWHFATSITSWVDLIVKEPEGGLQSRKSKL